MPTVVNCPSCSRKLRVPDDLLGQLVKCPTCGKTFTAAESEAPPVPAPRRPAPAPPVPKATRVPARLVDEEDDRPARRTPRPRDDDFEEVEERPSRRGLRRRDDDEDDRRPARRRDEEEDDDRRPARRRRDERPGKVQAIAIMTLVGGIVATVTSLSWMVVGLATCFIGCAWPGTYYSLALGIMAIIKGSKLLGKDAHREEPPKGIAIMQIINIINLDVLNCVLGIITLVFLNDREVQRYYRG